MEYNSRTIGERIRTARKIKGLSQEALIGKLKDDYSFGIGRNTLIKIENGDKTDFSFDFLLYTSRIFDCDIGYLLGEYKETKQESHFISSATGLSETAIFKLQREKDSCRIQQFNDLILHNSLWEILSYFNMYENVSKELLEENKKRSKLFWANIKNVENEEEKELYKRVSVAFEKRNYDYEMNRYKCQMLFVDILDKFLPKL